VISGNRPDTSAYNLLPEYLHIDGNLTDTYSRKSMDRIDMMSADFSRFEGNSRSVELSNEERARLTGLIRKAHEAGKPVRLWGAPDDNTAWALMKALGVDFINTDHIDSLAAFLKE
jgi:alkaline phosphatase